MKNQIDKLIKLQEVDTLIFAAKHSMQDIPEKISELEEAIKAKDQEMAQAEEAVKRLKIDHKEKENNLASKEESIQKYQAQLNQIKTNKEYSALQTEIDGIKADNSILEEEILQSFDVIETKEKEIKTAKEKIALEKKQIEEEIVQLKKAEAKARADLESIQGKRSEFSSGIDKNILSRYEHVLNGRDGSALVPVMNDTCSGCHMSLTPQMINEIKMAKEMKYCTSCARLLYIKEEENEEEPA